MPNITTKRVGFGYKAGVLAKLELTEQIRARSGLAYTVRTFQGQGLDIVPGSSPARGAPNVEFSVRRHSIDLPLQIEIRAPVLSSYLFGGMTYSFHQKTSSEINGSDYGVSIRSADLPDDLFVNLGVGLQTYASESLTMAIELGLESGTCTSDFGGTYRAVMADFVFSL